MVEKFKIWSQNNPAALEKISPKLGLREWDELSDIEKDKIYKHFKGKNWFTNDYGNPVFLSIYELNNLYKNQSYGLKTLEHNGPHYDPLRRLSNCCGEVSVEDFEYIFLNQVRDVVYEIITIYARHIIFESALKLLNDTTKENEKEREEIVNSAYQRFDEFAYFFNDISEHFSLNIILTRTGLILKQDEKITRNIYVPVLNFLSDPKWESVNRDLRDAFKDYQFRTQQGYSSCITHAISAVQAFLQLIVYEKTGKGDIGDLIIKARNKKLIPDDKFTEQVFKNLESILMNERQHSADAHPKKEYASEKNARLILNLIMIFFQHCI